MNSLLNMILRLSLVGGVTCLVCLAVSSLARKRIPKVWLSYLWLIVTVSFLAPVPAGLRLSIPQIRIPVASISSVPYETVNTAGMGHNSLALSTKNPTAVQAPDDQQDSVPAKGAPVMKLNIDLIITVIWLTGACGMLLWHMTGYRLAAGRLKKGRVCVSSGCVPVYESAKITTPLLVGLFHPGIYLPKGFKNVDLAVRHELCHWRRGDIWSKWLVQLAVCLHWFNPMVYIMKRELSRLSELACDEAVIRDMDEAERRAYGQMLLDTLHLASNFDGPMIAVLGNKKKWLRERLLGIMNKRPVTKNSVTAVIVLILCMLGTAVITGGVLSGCSPAGNSNHENTAPPVSVSANETTSAVPSAAASSTSEEASASPSAAAITLNNGGGEKAVADDESYKRPAGTWHAVYLADTEISRLLGYKVAYPDKLANFTLHIKILWVSTRVLLDAKTADTLSNSDLMNNAIVDDTAFSELSPYDPYRTIIVSYLDGNGNTIQFFSGKIENGDLDNPPKDASVTTIDSVNYYWITAKVPHVLGIQTTPPTKFDTKNFLSWSANGVHYSIQYIDPEKFTQQEMIDFASAFMAAQSD